MEQEEFDFINTKYNANEEISQTKVNQLNSWYEGSEGECEETEMEVFELLSNKYLFIYYKFRSLNFIFNYFNLTNCIHIRFLKKKKRTFDQKNNKNFIRLTKLFILLLWLLLLLNSHLLFIHF